MIREDFIEMLRQFSTLKGYEGWLLAKMIWQKKEIGRQKDSDVSGHLEETEKKWSVHEKKKKAFATITVQGVCNGVRHNMTIFLIHPQKVGKEKNACSKEFPSASCMETIRFTKEEVNAYLQDVGDYNPIHQGENAIVPGLCILQKLLMQSRLCKNKDKAERIEMEWKRVLRVNETCNLHLLEDGSVCGSVDERMVWILHI